MTARASQAITFHELFHKTPGDTALFLSREHDFQWNKFLGRAIQADGQPLVTASGVTIVARPGMKSPTFSLHKPIKSDYLTKRNQTSEEEPQSHGAMATDISKIFKDVDEEPDLAVCTVISFVDNQPYFGMCKTEGSSPGIHEVMEALNLIAPLEKSARWISKPAIKEAEIEKLRQAQGVTKFRGKFSGSSVLMEKGEAEGALVQMAQQISDRVGIDLDFKFEISLPEGHQDGREHQAKMRNLLTGSLSWLTRSKQDKPQATVVNEDGSTEQIRLFMNQLTVRVEVDQDSLVERKFSDLLRAVSDEVAHNREIRMG